MKKLAQRNVLLAAFVALVLGMLMTGAALAQDDTIVPLDHPLAPFLEARAYAAEQGATAEFRKMEWVAVDEINNKLYVAISDVGKGMSDGEGDIQLEENPCGAVYAGDLDADYNISNLAPLIVGGPYDENAEGDACATDNIASPDNLVVDPQGRLWIGEDTGDHENNAIWMWDGELHRFATGPIGAEMTGLWVADNGTVFFNVQHPDAVNVYPYNRAVIGVVNGFNANDDFEAMAAPEGMDKHKVTVAAGEYQILGRVGEDIPNDIYGQKFGEINALDGSLQVMCNDPDGNMWLPIDEEGTMGYLLTNFECIPGGVSQLYIAQNGESWDVLEGVNVDFASVNGTWTNCGSTVTPWNTGLTAEEYEPIATVEGYAELVEDMTAYLGEQANPYDYGYLVEISPAGLTPDIEKHYSLGRFSHENAVIMPDNKTVYHGDDGTNVVLFKSVLDEEGDLSASTLYAAKVVQLEDESFDLEWIELASGNNDEIAEMMDEIELP